MSRLAPEPTARQSCIVTGWISHHGRAIHRRAWAEVTPPSTGVAFCDRAWEATPTRPALGINAGPSPERERDHRVAARQGDDMGGAMRVAEGEGAPVNDEIGHLWEPAGIGADELGAVQVPPVGERPDLVAEGVIVEGEG